MIRKMSESHRIKGINKASDKTGIFIFNQVIYGIKTGDNISYTKEVLYSEFIPFFDRKYRADWVLQDGLVVEYFGLERDQGYADKSENKMEICKNNNVSLLDLYKKDLSNLLFIFEEYIH